MQGAVENVHKEFANVFVNLPKDNILKISTMSKS